MSAPAAPWPLAPHGLRRPAETFEYVLLTWPPDDDGTDTVDRLNLLGADGWEAVGFTTRTSPVALPGMGARPVPEVVVLLKRRM